MKNILTTLFIVAAIFSAASAQQTALFFMEESWQAGKTNPAFMSQKKFSIGLPHPYFHFSNSGPGYNDLVVRMENGERLIDAEASLGKFQSTNVVRVEPEVETMHLAFGGTDWQGSIYHNFKTSSTISYPKELVGMVLMGNAQYIGQNVSIAPKFSSISYSEIGMGYSKKMDRLSVGGRIKYLSGIHHFATDRDQLSIYTDSEFYEITASADYSILTAGLVQMASAQNWEDWNFDLGEFSANQIFGKNSGFAVDLGASYQVSEKLALSASLLDLGTIKWKENGKEFVSSGSYTFSGIDVLPYLEDEGFSLDNTLDTLQSIFEVTENSLHYATRLPVKSYLGATYKFTDLFQIGGLIYAEGSGIDQVYSFGIHSKLNLGSIASLGLNYSVSDEALQALGASLLLKLGPVQLFALSDNLITAIQPFRTGHTNLRMGLNLSFGKRTEVQASAVEEATGGR